MKSTVKKVDMDPCVGNLLLACALTASLALTTAYPLAGQTFSVLHDFSASRASNWDGAAPTRTTLTISGSTLYGTTAAGGTNGSGTLFSMSTGGSNFTVLHTFAAAVYPNYTNWDGAGPQDTGLLLVGSTLYGTTLMGGTNSGGYGTLFAVDTNGNHFSVLHSFRGPSDGGWPAGPLVLAGGRFYGVTEQGGNTGNGGTVFTVNTNGSDFLSIFDLGYSMGETPSSGLVLSTDTLYGSCWSGGAFGQGNLFSVRTNGYNNLRPFYDFSPAPGPTHTNADGAHPNCSLVLSGNTLLGTCEGGGPYGRGTIFAIATNGPKLTLLHGFTGGWDGGFPDSLLLSDGILYGVARQGGANGTGIIYSLKADGSDFQVLYNFDPDVTGSCTNYSGLYPGGALVLAGNNLYGMASCGGSYASGTVFKLSLPPPPLAISLSGENVTLSWPTNAGVFYLQSSTNLDVLGGWTDIEQTPVVTNGQNLIISPASGQVMFYRLGQ